jgi:hypothetical protein
VWPKRREAARCRQRQPHVFLILFSVWKPIKKENSRVSSTEIKTSEISLFPFSFRDSTMSSSSSSLSEKKKPPPVVDSDAAVPTASVPASAPSEPKPTESVPASAPSEPTKKKRVRQARQAQAVPGYGDVKVTELKPDRTEVFKLGWQARRVLHAAAAEPQSAEPSTPHAPIELRRDGNLDDSVIASLQRVAAQRPVAIEGLNNFHEAVEVLVGELLDGKMGGDDKVALLRDRLDKLHKASPKSAGSARAGAAAKATGAMCTYRDLRWRCRKPAARRRTRRSGPSCSTSSNRPSSTPPAASTTAARAANSRRNIAPSRVRPCSAPSACCCARWRVPLCRQRAAQCSSMLSSASFARDKTLAELQRFLIGEETTLTVADGHLVVPPADAKRTSYKAFAKCDARVVLHASAMLRECTKFEFARDAAEIELLQALGRLSGQDVVDRHYSKLKHSSLLLTVETLRRLARRPSFRALLDAAALRRLDQCDALVTLLPRFKEDAMLMLSPSSMVCVNRKCSPLALAVAVAPTIEAKHLLGATGVVLIGADSVHVLQNRAARDEARAKCRIEPLAQLPPRRARIVAQRSSPGLHRRRARAKCRGRHGGLGSATWARLSNGQLVDVPEKRKDLLGAKVLKKLTVKTAELINKLKMSGTNSTAAFTFSTRRGRRARVCRRRSRRSCADTSASAASDVVRNKLGDKWATGDVAFVDLGKAGNIYGVIHRAQLRREFVVDITKHTKRKLYDSANIRSFEETATRPGWVRRNRRHAVDVGIARMFKKSDPLIVFLNSDYTKGFTPVLRQLLRLGAFVVLVDEFRTSKHCHGCARELDTTKERCDKAVCPTCARGEEAHKRFGKLKLDQARRAVRELGQKKEAPVVVEVRADAQKLYEQNTSQAKAKAGAKAKVARGLTKQCTIELLCKLSGSVEGGKTRVLQGNNGGRLVHSIGTQISPPRAPNVLKNALSFQRVVALEQLSTANLRRRLWRALARAPCSDCQPHQRRCESCRRKAALNKAKKCCLCRAEISDEALLVSEEKTSWRIKRCPTEGCASGGRVHRDDNGARNCAKIVLFMFSNPAAGPLARPYPLWECDLERQHCADGKPMPWDKSWFGGRDDDRHDSSDDGESAPREHDDESADTGVTRHTAAPRQQHVGDEASGGDDESSDGSTAATLALSRRADRREAPVWQRCARSPQHADAPTTTTTTTTRARARASSSSARPPA